MRRPHRLLASACCGTYRYFLTFCTYSRRQCFVDRAVVDVVREHFLRTAAQESFAVIAYCFMPDHVHLLVEGQQASSNLDRFIRVAKQRTGFHISRAHGLRLWQESYFDRTLRREEALADVVRYVINNPLRAGLVSDVMDYPHWGSGAYTREELIELIQA